MIVLHVGLLTPRPTPSYSGGPTFSVRVISLSWLVPIWKRQELAFRPCMTYRKNVAQESRRGRACIELGRNRWYYPSFDRTHPPARCVPSVPHTTALTPSFHEYLDQNYLDKGSLCATTHLLIKMKYEVTSFYSHTRLKYKLSQIVNTIGYIMYIT
jgi:hypothetical protein